jgi:hypothetical protein
VQENGLLEQTVLLLPRPNAGARRDLLAAGGEPVGFARRQRRPWWQRWLPEVVAVHEMVDEPVVFTIRRGFGLRPSYRLLDAEDELVGTIALPWVLDRWGRPSVELTSLPAGRGEFRTLAGELLAEWTLAGSVVRLALHDLARGDPFVKMLLLAAMLNGPANGREWNG